MINGNGKFSERKPPLWAKIVGGIMLAIAFGAWVLVVAAMGKAAWTYLAEGHL